MAKTTRRRFQFTLFALLVVMAIAAVVSIAVRPWFYRPSETVTIVVTMERTIAFEDQTSANASELIERLKQRREVIESWGDEPVAVIKANAEALHVDVLAALDAAAVAGYISVSLQTIDDSDPGWMIDETDAISERPPQRR